MKIQSSKIVQLDQAGRDLYNLDHQYWDISKDTFRWAAALHTIPRNHSLRKMMTTRSPSMIMSHFDYSGNELRCIAGLAGEVGMMRAQLAGLDIHLENAKIMFNDPNLDKSTEDGAFKRTMAKTMTFAILYGGGIQMIAREYLYGDEAYAAELVGKFYTAFPKLKEWIDNQHAYMMEHKKVLFPLGATKDYWFNESDKGDVGKAMRDAQNHPVQGFASGYAGEAIYLIWKAMQEHDLVAIPTQFTHDAGIFEVEALHFLEYIKASYEYSVNRIRRVYKLPVDIDFELGLNDYKPMHLEDFKWEDEYTVSAHFKSTAYQIKGLTERFGRYYNVYIDKSEPKESVESIRTLFERTLDQSQFMPITEHKGKITLEMKPEFRFKVFDVPKLDMMEDVIGPL